MAGQNGSGRKSYLELRQELEAEWTKLCARYLPVTAPDWMWRFSRTNSAADPEQGWKLHISASVRSANTTLSRVGPFLSSSGVLFKAPASLLELQKINCGLFYGFSQVGKFFTVYPRNSGEAVSLARRLHQLTRNLHGPAVPYDGHFRRNSCIYYRYGAFNSVEIEQADGTRVPALKNQEGQLVPDPRGPGAAVPAWLSDPFPQRRPERNHRAATEQPLKTKFRAYEAVSQRGKGGVYRALDLSVLPARLCILKEGRRHGETDWDGRDGYWRVSHERRVLSALAMAGIPVAQVYETFQSGPHYYLVLEYIEGENLQSLLVKRGEKIGVARAIGYGAQIAKQLQGIHEAGWVWRDCKPLNLIVSKRGVLRPLDFEGACPVKGSDMTPWGTIGYVPAEANEEALPESRLPEDLYALGATLHHLLSGRPPSTEPPAPIGILRRSIPVAIRKTISALLDPDPQSRPDAGAAAKILEVYA